MPYESDNPWDFINSRYEANDLAQFEVVLDGVEEVVRLVQSPRLSDRRLALLLSDHLADVVLVRRVEQVIMVSERGGSSYEPRERFDARSRAVLKQRFSRRVDIAERDLSRRFSYGLGKPIISAGDAEILRVGHDYRNSIYHEDRQNEAALRPVTIAMLHATCRAWTALLPSNIASSTGFGSPLMERLLAKGYTTEEFPGSFSQHFGARAVADWVVEQLPFDLKIVRTELADDIDTRIGWAEAMLDWLHGREGPGEDWINTALRWADMWRQYEADPQLLELDEKRAVLLAQRVETPEEDDDHAVATDPEGDALRDTNEAYEARFREMLSHNTTLTLADIPKLRRAGSRLKTASTPHSLLARYRKLDIDIDIYETVLRDMAIGWDRYVEEESDRRRGR
jgi:hypothetical protein